MEEEMLFKVKTKMDKEDYRKFLYLVTFKKTPMVIPMMIMMDAIPAAIIAFNNGVFNTAMFFISWIVMIIIQFFVICIKIEYKTKNRIKTDRIGTFENYQVIKFYENYISVFTESIQGTSKISYENFYRVLQSKQYYIFYYNINMASLIRKKDIDNECVLGINKLLEEKLGDKFKRI